MLFTICLLFGYLLQCFIKSLTVLWLRMQTTYRFMGLSRGFTEKLSGHRCCGSSSLFLLTFVHKLLSCWSLKCFFFFYLGSPCWQNEDMDKQKQAELFSLMWQTVSVDFQRKSGPQHTTRINYAQQKRQSVMGLWHSQTWLVAMFYYI